MTEKPIIFNTQMVQAILNGTKTQTRRPVTKSHHFHYGCTDDDFPIIGVQLKYAPYKVGDILWVRETWNQHESNYKERCNDSGYMCRFCKWLAGCESSKEYYTYLADMSKLDMKNLKQKRENKAPVYKWRASIHMPRSAARIFLRVKKIRAEKLNDITNFDDAIKEGFVSAEVNGVYISAVMNFWRTWDRMYAKKCYGWLKNPFVWVIEFERINL